MDNPNTFNSIPKYLMYEKGKEIMYFHPVIIKWEWDGHSNAYYAMYAKFLPHSCRLDLSKVLFWVSGRSYEEAQDAFLRKVAELHESIAGKNWIGLPPVKLDLVNMR